MTMSHRSNADNSASILNNTIEAIKIDPAGKVTFPQNTYKSGEIIQTVYGFDDGNVTASATYANTTNTPIPFTPKSTNSTIIIQCSFNATLVLAASVNGIADFQINVGGGPVNANRSGRLSATQATGGIGVSASMAMVVNLPNASLAALAFRLFARVTSTANVAQAFQQSWIFTEVQN